MLPVINRANKDRADGHLWKARERLVGALGNHGDDQELLELLGDVHWEMGDYPSAGAVWFLTARDDERSEVARAALDEHHGGKPFNLLNAIPAKFDPEHYPSPAEARLRRLIEDLAEDGYIWRSGKVHRVIEPNKEGVKQRVAEITAVVAIILVFPVVWVVGLIVLISQGFDAL